MAYKPEGYPDLSPYLVVNDAEATLRFCKNVFDAVECRVHRKTDGEIEHGEVRIGDSLLMFGQKEGGGEALVHIYVSDPRATFRKAIEFGATELQPVSDQGDGDLRGGVKDENGTNWFFARQQKE